MSHTSLPRRLAALSLLASTLFPATAGAAELMPSAGIYLSWTKGPSGPRLGWGLQATGMVLVQGSRDCANLGPTPIGVGPMVQFGMRGLEAPRVVLAAAAGLDPFTGTDFLEGFHLEGGVTIPLGEEGEVGVHGGAALSTILGVNAFLRAAPGMGEPISIGGGVNPPGFFHYPGYCVIGRPARGDDGVPTTAAVRVAGDLDEVAAAWADDARMECDSIPAFLSLAAELLDLGAPRGLVSRALDAAEEEIHHALMAAAVARRRGAAVWPVLPPPPARSRLPRQGALERLAVESWVDGAIGEGAAADEAERAAREARDPTVAAHYAQIAVEERRHAHLGRDIAAWSLAEGGEPIREALHPLVEAERAPIAPHADLPDRLPMRVRRDLGAARAHRERQVLATLLA